MARESDALGALVNNTNFKEARDGSAELEDVDEETFIDFVQYAYTGRYGDVDECASSSTEDNEEVGMRDGRCNGCDGAAAGGLERSTIRPKNRACVAGSGWSTTGNKCSAHNNPFTTRDEDIQPAIGGFSLNHKKKKFWPSKKAELWERFKNSTCQTGPLNGKPSAPRQPSVEDLLRHARLYVFADCYGIVGLMQLALHNLGQALLASKFQIDDGDAAAIVALLEYCYDNPTPDALRYPLVLCAACHAETLWNQEDFRGVLEAHGELSADLVGLLIERLG